VPAVVRYAHARGADLDVSRFALPADVADHDEAEVTATAAGELLEAVSEALGEPYLALRLIDELRFRRYGPAELVARASATVGEALARMARYAPLVLPRLEWTLVEGAAQSAWHQRVVGHPRGIGRVAHEYGLAYVLAQCRRESGLPTVPVRVWFAHARPRDLGPLHRFFGTRDLDFGAEDSGFVVLRDALDAKLAAGDPRLLVTMEEIADAALRSHPRAQRFADLVAARIETLLLGDASMDAVARALHMSARTLQRRLDAEGTGYSEVQDGVREKLARAWTSDATQTLGDIAYRLGFSDLATFSRAFKRWTGMPPGTWRKNVSRGGR
jgi:AraC-like DNA-binding protein